MNTSRLCPNIAVIQLYYGEEQNFYLYDNNAPNYLYGPVHVLPYNIYT